MYMANSNSAFVDYHRNKSHVSAISVKDQEAPNMTLNAYYGVPHRLRPSVVAQVTLDTPLDTSDDVMPNHFDTRIIISLEDKRAGEELQRWIDTLAYRLGFGITLEWEGSISNAFHLVHITGRDAEQRAARLVAQSPIFAGEFYGAISRYSAEVESNPRGLRQLMRVSFTAVNDWSDQDLRKILEKVGVLVNSRRIRAGDWWKYSALVQTESDFLITDVLVNGTLKLSLHYEGVQMHCDNCSSLNHAHYNCPYLSNRPLSLGYDAMEVDS